MTNKDALRKALHDLLKSYIDLGNSVTGGGWNADDDEVVIQARAALALFSKPIPGVEQS